MKRLLIVEFGPSRSKRFAKAVAAAQRGPGECVELEPGRYRVSFLLGTDAAVYRSLAYLLQGVRHWRATDVYQAAEPVSSYLAREMAWCASEQLGRFGDCRWSLSYGIPPRCSLCPLFDPKWAARTSSRETPTQQVAIGELAPRPEPDFHVITDLDFLFDREVRALLDWQIPDWMDLSRLIPDFPPAAPDEPAADQPDELDDEPPDKS